MKTNDKIKAALKPDIPQWDDNALWDKIETQLPEKKKKNRFFWLFFFGGLIAVGAFFLLGDFNANENAVAASIEGSNTKDKNTIEEIKTTQQSNDKVHTEKPFGDSQSKTVKNQSNGQTSNSLTATQSKTIEKINLAQDSPPAKMDLTNYRISQGEQSPPQRSYINIQKTSKPSESKNELTTIESAERKNVKGLLSTPTTLSQQVEFLSLSTLSLMVFTPDQDFDTEIKIKQYYLVDKQIKNEPIKPASSIHLSAGILNTMRRLETSTETDWVNRKQATESLKETIDFQFSYQKGLFKNISISAGLGFRQIVELSTAIDSLVETQPVVSDSAFIVNTISGPVYLAGTAEEKSVQRRTTITPNRYRRIYLPLKLLYDLPLRRSTLQLGIGANLDLYSNFDGAALDFDQTRTKDPDQIAAIYDNKVDLSELSFQLNYIHPIANKLDLFVGVQYVRGVRNHLRSERVGMRYDHFGMVGGFRF